MVVSTIQLGPGFGFVEGGFNSNGIVVSLDGSVLGCISLYCPKDEPHGRCSSDFMLTS